METNAQRQCAFQETDHFSAE